MGPAAMPSTDSLPWGSFWLSRVPTGLSLAPRVCRLKVPSWTAAWSLEWSAASSFEAGDTCSKEPIILLLPISDISGVRTCKFIIFGPFWFQLRFSTGEIKHRKHLGCVDARQNKGVFCVQPDKFRALGEQSESEWIPLFLGCHKTGQIRATSRDQKPPKCSWGREIPPYFWDEI